jgi:hypothetical protein
MTSGETSGGTSGRTSSGRIALRPHMSTIAPSRRTRFLGVASYVIVVAVVIFLWTRVPGALASPSGFFRVIGAILLVLLILLSLAAVVVPGLVLWPRMFGRTVVLAADGISLSLPGQKVVVPWEDVDHVSLREVTDPPAVLAAAWLKADAGSRGNRHVRRFRLVTSGASDGPLWLGAVGASNTDQDEFERMIHQWVGRPVVSPQGSD